MGSISVGRKEGSGELLSDAGAGWGQREGALGSWVWVPTFEDLVRGLLGLAYTCPHGYYSLQQRDTEKNEPREKACGEGPRETGHKLPETSPDGVNSPSDIL